MSEEEIIEILKGYDAKNKKCLSCAVPNREACVLNESDCIDEAIQGLLDLYNKEKTLSENHKIAFEKQTENLHEIEDLYKKEKEKNKLLIEGKFREVADKNSYIKDNYISKDKIREIANKRNEIEGNYREAYYEILELLEERN